MKLPFYTGPAPLALESETEYFGETLKLRQELKNSPGL
jgi:hypothetical protein